MIFRSQANCSNIQAAVLLLKLALSLCFVNLWYIYIYIKKIFNPFRPLCSLLYICEIFQLEDWSTLSSLHHRMMHSLICLTTSSRRLPLAFRHASVPANLQRDQQSDGQKRSHVPPLTLCAMFSGWVMSHCSLLSLMQRAMGRSDWPHSATFTSPVRIWSHTSHFTFSLLQPVINLLNQSLFNFSSPEIHNGRQIHWAATSSYENEMWCFYRLGCACIRLNTGWNAQGVYVICIT